jgi:hypothetical protein
MVDTLEMTKVKINKTTAERKHDKRTQRTIFHDVPSGDLPPLREDDRKTFTRGRQYLVLGPERPPVPLHISPSR